MTSTQDFYPTRIAGEPQEYPRQEPVVYGGSGPLTPEQLAQFERHGFLLAHNVFSPDEISAMRQEFARMQTSKRVRQSPQAVCELGSDVLRSVFDIHRSSPEFAAYAADTRLAEVAKQIVGSDVYIHQSRINFKPAFDGKEFQWHSDFETWHAEDGMAQMRCVSASIWLDDNTPFNGALMVIPGSHKTFCACVGQTPEDNYKASLRRQVVGVPATQTIAELAAGLGMEMPTGKAGAVLFFDCNVLHASGGNISPWPRSNVFFVYNSVENALVAPFAGTKPRPDYIAAREFEPVERLPLRFERKAV